VASIDRVDSEAGERPEDLVRRVMRLKKALNRARTTLGAESDTADPTYLSRRVFDIVDEMGLWETALEEVREELAELIAERDRWRIAHDKLRERLDRHSLKPRMEVAEAPPKSGKLPAAPRLPMPSNESQDFTAIDAELERLNASMLAAFSSE
jgi:regulator of replication initiation timing